MKNVSDIQLKIVVAALTRRRPDMLASLIDSWGAATLPEDCDVTFLIVENDDTPRSLEAVKRYGSLDNGSKLRYVHESELGIPFGRNRAAREAIADQANLLAFVDDDEVVSTDWLVRLINAYRQSGAVLIGGPLRVKDTNRTLTVLQTLMERGVRQRYVRKETRASRRGSLKGTPGVTIVTNNWLAELSVFTEHGIWFDEKMRFTGGTDSKLYADVRAAGLSTAWAADAAVYEEIPEERLSIAYQFKRGRDQSSTNFRRKIARRPTARLDLLVFVPLKVLMCVFLVILLPFSGGRSLLDTVRTSGWIVGRFDALLGRRSDLYATVTGS